MVLVGPSLQQQLWNPWLQFLELMPKFKNIPSNSSLNAIPRTMAAKEDGCTKLMSMLLPMELLLKMTISNTQLEGMELVATSPRLLISRILGMWKRTKLQMKS